MTHTTDITILPGMDGLRVGDVLLEDRFFFAFQALKSQGMLAAYDNARSHGAAESAKHYREAAVSEWSEAVKQGFVCC